MNSLHYLIQSTIEPSIAKAQAEQKPLIIYTVGPDNSDTWINSWIEETDIENLKVSGVILKLIEGTQEFGFFKSMMPGVVFPALYCMFQSQLVGVVFEEKPDEDLGQEEQEKKFQERKTMYQGKLEDWLALYTGAPEEETVPVPATRSGEQVPTQDGRNSYPNFQQYTDLNSTEVSRNDSPIYDLHDNSTDETSSEPLVSTSISDASAHNVAMTESEKRYRKELVIQQRRDTEEKLRIKLLLKQDKLEREARQKELKRAENQVETSESNADIKDNISFSKILTEKCALSIKLTDGKSLTHTFNSNDTLDYVRTWVEEHRTDGDSPFLFHRSIPRVTFGDADELKSLTSLELPPRSVLILKSLEHEKSNKIVHASNAYNPGFLGKVYSGMSNWWNKNSRDSILNTSVLDDSEDNTTSKDDGDRVKKEPRHFDQKENQEPKETSPSPSIRSHSATPNVYQLNLEDNDNDQRKTYNGNNVNLEDDKKKKD